MRKIIRAVWILSVVLSVVTTCYAQGWHGIVPLKSTRQHVEQLLGRPPEANGITYDLETEIVSIFYSGARCVKGWPHGWNVAPDTVVKIAAYPKISLPLSQLGVDLNTYQKIANPRLGGN